MSTIDEYDVSNKWHLRFLDIARTVSGWSKDGTKVGSVIVRPDKTIASVGFNGLPPGVNDDEFFPVRDETMRARKNAIVLHAEENAVLSCTDASLEGYTAYVYGLHPCGHCASVLARKKIKRVVSVGRIHPGWQASQDVTDVVFGDRVNHIKVELIE